MRLKALLYSLWILLVVLTLALFVTAAGRGSAQLWTLAAFSAVLTLLFFYACRFRVLRLFEAVGDALGRYDRGEYPARADLPGKGDEDGRAGEINRLLEQAAQGRRTLQETQHLLEAITRNLPGCVLRLRADDYQLLYVSSSCQRLMGFTVQEVEARFGGNFLLTIRPEDRDQVERQLRETAARPRGGECILRYRPITAAGQEVWLMGRATLELDETGSLIFYGVLLDITEEEQALEALRVSRERYRLILEQSDDIICEWDFATDVLSASSKWEKRFGYPAPREKFSQRMASSPNIYEEDLPAVREWMEETRRGGQDTTAAEVRIRTAGGRFLWTRLAASVIRGPDGRPERAVGVIQNIDEERRELDRLRTSASADPLTGIYNKAAARRLTEEYLADAGGKALCALMLLDVDNFKILNDTRGHLYGDSVLCDIAARLQGLFRDSDVVGRIGGDEFMVFLRNLPSRQILREKAESVAGMFRRYFSGCCSPGISCSLGVAISPDHGEAFNELYRRADIALYVAKVEGKDCWRVYDPGMESREFLAQPPEASDVRGPVPEILRTGARNELLAEVFGIFCSAEDPWPAMDRVMELVGSRCGVGRAYIFRKDSGAVVNAYEWCAPGIPSGRRVLQGMLDEAPEGYFHNFDENGVFYCSDVGSLAPAVRGLLEPRGVSAMLQCAIGGEGDFCGFVGFDQCGGAPCWTRAEVDALALISRFVGIFLGLRPQGSTNKEGQQC